MKKILLASLCMLMAVLAAPAGAGLFPPEGNDVIPDTTVDHYIQLLPAYGGGLLHGVLDGPTVIQRSDPYAYTLLGGDEAIDTEIVSMDMVGNVSGWAAEFHLQASPASVGMIIDTNSDPASSFPAESFFDIFFEITLTSGPMTGLTLHNNDPLRMASTINEIPPDLALTAYTGAGWIPIGQWQPREYPPEPLYDLDDPDNRLYLYDPSEQPVGYLLEPIHSPEPATICLLGLGGLALVRRRRG